MISVEAAKQILSKQVTALCQQPLTEKILLTEALGRVSAAKIVAPIAVPLFDNSAMDGFAIYAETTLAASEQTPIQLTVIGEIKAGDKALQLSSLQMAIRIMTGAAIPAGANAVIKKEDVIEKYNIIQLKQTVKLGNNIRKQGEDFKVGDLVLDEGKKITPGIIALLASIGVKELVVVKQPRVAIITTGHELVSAIEELTSGKILESNGSFLNAALREINLQPVISTMVEDDPVLLKQQLKTALEVADIVMVTGGVSVGEHDYTRSVLEQLGVTQLFWKVSQKPGKPLYVGTLGKKIIFGLPGNPYAVFTTYYFYIRPVLLSLMGHTAPELKTAEAKLTRAMQKKDQRTQFLKGKSFSKDGELRVDVLQGQGSHLLGALADADCLIEIPAEGNQFNEGDKVKIYFLP